MSTKKVFITIGIAFTVFLMTLPLISYKFLKKSVEVEVFNHLITVRELLKSQIEGYFQDRFGDVDVLARNPVTGQAFSRLEKAFHASGLDGPQYTKIAGLYEPLMEHYLTDYGYVNIYFVAKDGDVIFSAIREEFTGTNLLTGRYKQFSIGQVFASAFDGVAFEDYTWHEEMLGIYFLLCRAGIRWANVIGRIDNRNPFLSFRCYYDSQRRLGRNRRNVPGRRRWLYEIEFQIF